MVLGLGDGAGGEEEGGVRGGGGGGGCSFSTCLKCSHSTIDHASLSRLEHQDGEERRGDGDERDTLSGVSSCMAHACLGGCVRRADA